MKVWRKFHNNIPSRLEANFDHRSSNQLTTENDMLAYSLQCYVLYSLYILDYFPVIFGWLKTYAVTHVFVQEGL